MKKTIIISLLILISMFSGCNREPTEIIIEYQPAYIKGWNDCIDNYPTPNVHDFLININKLPYDIRGCYINYYLDNYSGYEQVYFKYEEGKLYNEYGTEIDCEVYK